MIIGQLCVAAVPPAMFLAMGRKSCDAGAGAQSGQSVGRLVGGCVALARLRRQVTERHRGRFERQCRPADKPSALTRGAVVEAFLCYVGAP